MRCPVSNRKQLQ